MADRTDGRDGQMQHLLSEPIIQSNGAAAAAAAAEQQHTAAAAAAAVVPWFKNVTAKVGIVTLKYAKLSINASQMSGTMCCFRNRSRSRSRAGRDCRSLRSSSVDRKMEKSGAIFFRSEPKHR